jgi:hypothetical protein
VTLVCLPLGCGSMLTRRFAAKELAGLVDLAIGLLSEVGSLDLGCNEARRFAEDVRADIDD